MYVNARYFRLSNPIGQTTLCNFIPLYVQRSYDRTDQEKACTKLRKPLRNYDPNSNEIHRSTTF